MREVLNRHYCIAMIEVYKPRDDETNWETFADGLVVVAQVVGDQPGVFSCGLDYELSEAGLDWVLIDNPNWDLIRSLFPENINKGTWYRVLTLWEHWTEIIYHWEYGEEVETHFEFVRKLNSEEFIKNGGC